MNNRANLDNLDTFVQEIISVWKFQMPLSHGLLSFKQFRRNCLIYFYCLDSSFTFVEQIIIAQTVKILCLIDFYRIHSLDAFV